MRNKIPWTLDLIWNYNRRTVKDSFYILEGGSDQWSLITERCERSVLEDQDVLFWDDYFGKWHYSIHVMNITRNLIRWAVCSSIGSILKLGYFGTQIIHETKLIRIYFWAWHQVENQIDRE